MDKTDACSQTDTLQASLCLNSGCSPQERDLSKATQFSRAGAQWSTYVSAIILVSVAGDKRTPVFARAPSLCAGQVVIDPEYPAWLKREGGSHLCICGPGDPEDFL